MFRNTSEVAAEGFAAKYGTTPEGVWSVPGRVSLMGDHTDREDGVTFGFTISARSAVAASRRPDRVVRVVSDLTEERIETTLDDIVPPVEQHAWHDYPLGTIWAVLGDLQLEPAEPDAPQPVATGIDLFVTSDLPVGGGLASSASVSGAVAHALNDLWSLGLDAEQLARLGYRVENHYVGASTGMSDHITVLCGQEGKDVFYDSRGSDFTLIDAPNLADEGLTQLLIETGETHRNWEDIIVDRHQACDRVGEALGYRFLRELPKDEFIAATNLDPTDRKRAHYVITEIQRALDLVRLLRTKGAAAAVHLLNESQNSLREDFEATTQRIDLTCEVALAAGALGARMTGSGFGGSVLAVVPIEHEIAVRENLAAAYTEYGWDAPKIYPVNPAPGARRDL